MTPHGPDRMAVERQVFAKMPANKAGRAGDEKMHIKTSITPIATRSSTLSYHDPSTPGIP